MFKYLELLPKIHCCEGVERIINDHINQLSLNIFDDTILHDDIDCVPLGKCTRPPESYIQVYLVHVKVDDDLDRLMSGYLQKTHLKSE